MHVQIRKQEPDRLSCRVVPRRAVARRICTGKLLIAKGSQPGKLAQIGIAAPTLYCLAACSVLPIDLPVRVDSERESRGKRGSLAPVHHYRPLSIHSFLHFTFLFGSSGSAEYVTQAARLRLSRLLLYFASLARKRKIPRRPRCVFDAENQDPGVRLRSARSNELALFFLFLVICPTVTKALLLSQRTLTRKRWFVAPEFSSIFHLFKISVTHIQNHYIIQN